MDDRLSGTSEVVLQPAKPVRDEDVLSEHARLGIEAIGAGLGLLLGAALIAKQLRQHTGASGDVLASARASFMDSYRRSRARFAKGGDARG